MISERSYMRQRNPFCANCGTPRTRPASTPVRQAVARQPANHHTLTAVLALSLVVAAVWIGYHLVTYLVAAVVAWWMTHWIIYTAISVVVSPFLLVVFMGAMAGIANSGRKTVTINVRI